MLNINTFKDNFNTLRKNFLEKTYLLAVSGGVDSMVLLYLLQISGCKFQVAHINYKLRGEDSDLDQKLVEDCCNKNQIKFHLYTVSEKDQQPQNSIQNWARQLRYHFFNEIKKQENIDFLVTAHHLNDELETFFINLSRASGIKGLSGIPKNENQILRPLLKFPKDEIYSFAKENKIDFREDKSNKKNDYLRNEIRNQLTPEIIKVFPNFLESFQESLSHLSAVNLYYQEKIDKCFYDVFISGTENEFILNKDKLFQSDEILVREIIRKLGFSGIEIEKIIRAENGKMFRSSTHEIVIKKAEISVMKKNK